MGHSLIKGVAGSGKTTVAVSRIPFLLKNYCMDSDDRVLMVTFNKSLTKYIGYIYAKAEENSDEEQLDIFGAPDSSKLEIVNIDKLIFKYCCLYCKKHNLYLKNASNSQQYEILRSSIAEIQKNYPDVKHIDVRYAQFLLKEITWIKACNYMELSQYQTVDRLGRTSSKTIDGPQKLQKNSKTREAIYELMILYNKKLREAKLCDFEDRALMALDFIKNNTVNKYTHILIDESQDLSKIQLEFLVSLFNYEKTYSSIVFIADTAQSIYEGAWLVKGRSFTTIGFDMTGKSNSLSKNYRTTTQIAQAAYSLIEKDNNITEDDNFVKPALIDRQGSYPVLKSFNDLSSELHYISELISNQLLGKYNYNEIAIIARNNKILEEAENSLKESDIPCTNFKSNDELDFMKNDVKLLTMHSIKGLEFKVIIIIGLSSSIIPSPYILNSSDDSDFAETMERKLLYVGMTRANECLYMSYHGEPSKFLKDINSRYLKLQAGANIRNFYSVSVKDYLFVDKIADPYSNEEKIRQWLIKELQEMYKYPESLIDVEYKVNVFSKQGSVDAVVKIHRNNEVIPYIFFECKRKGTGTQQALEQLKSYIAVTPQVCYGVVTDGNDYIVINRKGELLEDIPSFDLSMMPSSVDSYEYHDLLHGRKYNYLLDAECQCELIVEQNGREIIYDSDMLTPFSLITNIAAGKPIEIVDDITDQIYLPEEWLKNNNDTFALTVRGDSMIEANIDDGDIVFIRMQTTADNRSIVAAEVDGSATLKRLVRMGSSILLQPENPDYEPIMVREDEVRIIGVAVGLIKKG